MCSPEVKKLDACEVLNEEKDWRENCFKCNEDFCNVGSNFNVPSFCFVCMYGWFYYYFYIII